MPTLPPEILANLASKRLGIQSQRDTGLQQLGQQYNTNLFNLDKYATEGTRKINDQFASQGLFNSGIRVNEQGRLQTNVGERRGFLGQQYAQGQTGIENQYANALQGLEDYRTQAMQEATRNEQQQQQAAAQQALQQQQFALQQRQADEARWYAAAAANQGGGGGGGGGMGGQPSQAALDQWFAEVQRQEAIKLWNATILWNQAMQSPNRTEFAGSGNPLGMAGARFK